MARKKFSKALKARVALEAIKGQKTINEIASENDIHPSQVNQWKKHLLDNMEGIFARGTKTVEQDHEQEKEKLYGQIGKLKVEADWLKKNASSWAQFNSGG